MIAFIVAFAMMIIPIVTIAILLGSLYSLVLVFGAGALVRRWESALARRRLLAGRCPRCREQVTKATSEGWTCVWCGAAFLPSGAEVMPEDKALPDAG